MNTNLQYFITIYFLSELILLSSVYFSNVMTSWQTDSIVYKLKLRLFCKVYNFVSLVQFSTLGTNSDPTLWTFAFKCETCLIINNKIWYYCFSIVTNFIQLVSPQLVDRFSQTKLRWKALNEGYLHICGIHKSDNKWLRYQAINSCKSFVC